MHVEEVGGRNADMRGIRYYLPAPYLLVYSNGEGTISSQILYMPDQDRMMSIDPYSVLASNTTTLNFSNGMLTQGRANTDATAVPEAMLNALKTAAVAAYDAANVSEEAAGNVRRLPPPYLFRIHVDSNENTYTLIGGAAVAQDGGELEIHVTISQAADPATSATPATPPARGGTP